jgi:ABC-2 type transport system permease protein
MDSFARVLALVKKEFRQILRDRLSLGLLLFVPLLLLVLFGYAISLDVKHVRLGIYDGDLSVESRNYLLSFIGTEYFELTAVLDSSSRVDEEISNERIQTALVVPPDFSKEIRQGGQAEVQVVVDGSNGTTAATILGYVNAITEDFAQRLRKDGLHGFVRLTERRNALHRSGTESGPVEIRSRVWYNPELRSTLFLIPGLVVFILLITTVIATSMSVARERERGTMEQLSVSPVSPLELVLGKTIPYTVISSVITIGVLFISRLLFGLVIRGSLLFLFGASLLFLLGGLGLGLLISTVAGTQQVAFLISVIATLLPCFVLSGFVFPIRNMPVVLQAVTYLLPARYYLTVLRGIMLKGVGIGILSRQVLFLAGFAALTLLGSMVRLRRWL